MKHNIYHPLFTAGVAFLLVGLCGYIFAKNLFIFGEHIAEFANDASQFLLKYGFLIMGLSIFGRFYSRGMVFFAVRDRDLTRRIAGLWLHKLTITAKDRAKIYSARKERGLSVPKSLIDHSDATA